MPRKRDRRFLEALGAERPQPPETDSVARVLVGDTLDFIGRARLLAAHPAYAQGDWFRKVVEGVAIHLRMSSEGAEDWTSALNANLQVLIAQQTYLTALVTGAQAKAAQYADTAALFQALGAGWWNRSDVKAPPKDNDFFKFLR